MCDFVFDPDLWPNSTSHDHLVRCPYRSVPLSDYCVFHLFPPNRRILFPRQEDLIQEMEGAVEAAGRIHLVCVTLPHTDLLRFIDKIDPRSELNILFSWVRSLDMKDLEIKNKITC